MTNNKGQQDPLGILDNNIEQQDPLGILSKTTTKTTTPTKVAPTITPTQTKPTQTKNPFEPTRSVNQVGQNVTEGINVKPTSTPYYSKTKMQLNEELKKKEQVDAVAKEQILKKDYIEYGENVARSMGKSFVYSDNEFTKYKNSVDETKMSKTEKVIDNVFSSIGNTLQDVVDNAYSLLGAEKEQDSEVMKSQKQALQPLLVEKNNVDSKVSELKYIIDYNDKANKLQSDKGKNLSDMKIDEFSNIDASYEGKDFFGTDYKGYNEFKKQTTEASNILNGRLSYLINENQDKLSQIQDLKQLIDESPDSEEKNAIITQYNLLLGDKDITEIGKLYDKKEEFKNDIVYKIKSNAGFTKIETETKQDLSAPSRIIGSTVEKLASGTIGLIPRVLKATGYFSPGTQAIFDEYVPLQTISENLYQNANKLYAPKNAESLGAFYKYSDYDGYKVLVNDNGIAYDIRDKDLNEIKHDGALVSQWNNLPKSEKIVKDGTSKTSALYSTVQSISDMVPLIASGYVTGGASVAEQFGSKLAMTGIVTAQMHNDIYEGVKDRTDLTEQQKNAYALAISTAIGTSGAFLTPALESRLAGAEKKTVMQILNNNASKYLAGKVTAWDITKELSTAFGKNLLKEIPQENIEELIIEPLIQNVVTGITNGLTDSKIEIQRQTKDDLLETIGITSLATGVMGVTSMFKSRNDLMNESLLGAVSNYDNFNKQMLSKIESGVVTEDAGKKVLNVVEKIKNTIEQGNITKENDITNLSLLMFQNEQIGGLIESNIDDALKAKYKEQINSNKVIINKILNKEEITNEDVTENNLYGEDVAIEDTAPNIEIQQGQEAKLEIAPTPIATDKEITTIQRKIELGKALGEDVSDLENQLKTKQDAVSKQISNEIVLPTKQLELGLSEVEQRNQEPKVATEQSSQAKEEVKIEEVTQSESNPALRDVVTPEGFTNRVFESNMQLGEAPNDAHISEEGFNYRVLSQNEIDAIRESGGVFAREGKQKGGNKNTKYWTKGNTKNWYGDKDNLETIRVNQSNFSENEVVRAENVEVFNKETGKFEPLIKSESILPKEQVSTMDTKVDTKVEKVEPTAPKELTLEQKKHNRIADLVKSFNGLTDRQKSGADGSSIRQDIIKLSSELGYSIANDGKKIKVTNDKGKEVKKIGLKEEKPLSSQEDIDYAMSEISKGRFDWNGSSAEFRVNLGIPWSDIRQGVKDLQNGKPNSLPAKRLVEALVKNKEQGGYEIVAGSGALMVKEFVPFDQLDLTYELSADEEQQVLENQAELEKEANEYFNNLTEEEQIQILEANGQEITDTGSVEQSNSESESKTDVSDKKSIQQVTQEIKVKQAEISKKENELANAKSNLEKYLKENQAEMFDRGREKSMFDDKAERQDNYNKKEKELATLREELKTLEDEKTRIEDSKNQGEFFQTKKKGKFETISKENFQKLIGKLKKAFPKINVNLISNDKTIEVLSKGGVDILKTKTGTIYGFVKDGEIYINEDVGLNANTPIHEFSHVWVQTMKAQFPNTYKNIIEKIKQEKSLIEQKRKDPNYSKLSNDALADEVLAEMVGNKGEKDFLDGLKGAKKTLIQQVLKSVSDLWKRIKDIFTSQSPNIKKWTNEQFQNATIEDIVNNVTADLLGGREVGREEKLAKGVTLMTLPNGEKVKVKNVNSEVVNGFYSNTENALAQVKQDKMSGNQWVTQLLSRGANKEEMKWTTLSDFLEQNKDKSISKSDIQQYLKDNRIEVVEVVKGEGRSESDIKQDIYNKGYELESDMGSEGYIITDKNGNIAEYDELPNDVRELYDELSTVTISDASGTKFSQYQLEGQKENYKEVLVTMPVVSETAKSISEKYWEAAKARDEYKKQNAPRKQREDIVAYIDRANAELKNDAKYQELTKNAEVLNKRMDDANKNQGEKFKSSHFDEPNILVHLRMNTRTDANGNKVLFLEEVQSDWGQSGKKEGFKEPSFEWDTQLGKDAVVVLKKMNETAGFSDWKGLATAMAKSNDILNDFQVPYDNKDLMLKWHKAVNQERKTPQAPFVTDTNSWTKLGLKVALKEAVKQGADKIAWTTGEQQNERYDLSKQVDKIDVEAVEDVDGLFFVDIKLSNGTTENLEVENGIIREGNYKGQRLDSVIGKDYADKILSTPKGDNVTLQGDDLKVGGKGMKGFYGSPTEGSLGIVGNVAKSLFKQEPKTIVISKGNAEKNIETKTLDELNNANKSNKDLWIENKENGNIFSASYTEAKDALSKGYKVGYLDKGKDNSTQHSIDITPELKAQVEEGQALFQIDSSNASKNDKETAIKNLVEKWKADGLSDTEIKNILSESETGKTFIDKLFPKEPKERSFSRTLEDMPTQVQNLVENKDYIPTTNPEQEAVADNFIKENGIEEATKILIDNKTSELSDAETNIVAMKLIKINNKNGNYKESARIFDEVAEKLTEAGRLIQTAALWNLMTEQGAVEYAMRLKSKGRNAQKEVVEQEVKTTKEKIIEIAREINGSKEIKDAIAKIYSKRERISKTKSQKAIDWLESIKVKDMAFTALPGVNLLPATYNTAINIIQTGIKANIMLNTAVAQAVKYIRENITADESFDESKFKKFILDNLPKIEDDAIKVAEQELGKKISDVVNAHYDIKEEYKKSLLDSILSKTDLTESEAKVIADIVETKFAQEADKKLDALEKKQKSQAKKVDDKIAKVESEIKAIENGTYKQDKKYPTTKSEKQKELDVLRKQKRELLGTEQPYVKIVDRINKGTISNADMKELLYSDIGLSNLDANTIAKIEEMHRKVKDAPQGSAEQRDRLADLLDFIDKEINGTDNWAIAKSLMYASLLSASSTQVKNFISNTMQMTAEAYVNSMLMLAKGDAKGISGLAKGLLVGLERGGLEAIKVLKTGYDPNKKVLLLDSNPKISRKDILESYTGNIKPISWAKYVRRLMVAADTLFYYGVKEMESYVLARQIALKSGLKGKALTDKINETLLKGESYYNEFKKQAIQEGYLDPKTQKRRIFELIEMNRDRTITDKADVSALKATYNNDPVGFLGDINRRLQNAKSLRVGSNKLIDLIVTSIIPFTRVISNVVNEQLNWTPLGYARALTEKGSIFSSPEQMKLTNEERSKLVIKATTGMLLAIGFLAYALKDDDDEDKIFDVTANGYGNSYKNTSLYPLGWKPYTIGIKMPNGKWIRYSYQNTPFGQLLGMIGTIADSKKYNKDADMTDRVGLFASTTANQMFSASALQGASTLFDALGSKDSDNMNKILELAISKAKMPIPNIAKEAYNIFDNQLYDKSDIKGMVINNVPVFQLLGRPKLNVFGEPIKKSRYGALLLLPETDNTLKSLYEVGVVPTIPLKNKKIYGEEMTNEQFYDYVETRGKYLRKITEEKIDYITSFTDKREAKSKYSDIEQQATKEAEDIIYNRYFKK